MTSTTDSPNPAATARSSNDDHVGLAAIDLRVVYDGFVAVEKTTLHVAPGESFGIVGESGSGKSTVLRAICGLAPMESGKVQLIGGGDRTLVGPRGSLGRGSPRRRHPRFTGGRATGMLAGGIRQGAIPW